MEVFVQNSPIYCIFRLPSVTDRFNPNIQFPDQICYSDTLPSIFDNLMLTNFFKLASVHAGSRLLSTSGTGTVTVPPQVTVDLLLMVKIDVRNYPVGRFVSLFTKLTFK